MRGRPAGGGGGGLVSEVVGVEDIGIGVGAGAVVDGASAILPGFQRRICLMGRYVCRGGYFVSTYLFRKILYRREGSI